MINDLEDWSCKWFFALVALTAILVLILLSFTFNMMSSLAEIHINAVKECVEINQAANGTVCLV